MGSRYEETDHNAIAAKTKLGLFPKQNSVTGCKRCCCCLNDEKVFLSKMKNSFFQVANIFRTFQVRRETCQKQMIQLY